MEEDLVNQMEEQRKRMIEKFKIMSIKYIDPKKHELWKKFIDEFYSQEETSISSMEETFNYISQLTDKSHPIRVAELFMRRTVSFDHASKIAKVVAFFAVNGEKFYQKLHILAHREGKDAIIDTNFFHNLHEVNASDDIDLAMQLFDVKRVRVSIDAYDEMDVLVFNNGFIKGLTWDKDVVIGEKIDNYYVFYIIESDGTYQRFLIHDPKTAHLNSKKQSTWGFVTNEKGEFLSKVTNKPEVEDSDEVLTLEEFKKLDDIYGSLNIIPVLHEIYGLTRPINEDSKTLTIQAIMYKEMQESMRLEKELKQ